MIYNVSYQFSTAPRKATCHLYKDHSRLRWLIYEPLRTIDTLIKFRALSACVDLINAGFASTDPVSLSSSACMPTMVRIFWRALILILCSDLAAALHPALRGAYTLGLQSGTQDGSSMLLALPIPAVPKIRKGSGSERYRVVSFYTC